MIRMPLANILLISALAFPGAQSRNVWAFLHESQAPQAAPKSDSPQEAPKPAPPESGRPDQAAPPPAVPDSQSPPPTTSEKPPNPPAEPSETKPAEAVPPAEKQSPGGKKDAETGRKCQAPSSLPRKRVVRGGSTAEPTIQFAPGLTQGQAAAQRQSTTQLLAGTEANLKKISNRQLVPSQREAVNQIRRYMEQAKTAEASGDLQRAHNLAFKARLLSDELLRR